MKSPASISSSAVPWRRLHLFEHNRPIQYWVTRYFKSLDKEELLVSVHPETAKVLGFRHTLPGRPRRRRPRTDAARDTASAFAGELGLGVGAMELKESRSEKKKARRDHTFVWEALASDRRNVDEARFRVEAEVDGDQVCLRPFLLEAPRGLLAAPARDAMPSPSLWSPSASARSPAPSSPPFSCSSRTSAKGWSAGSASSSISIPIALLTAVGPLLSMRLLLQNYQTAIPLETFQAVMYMVVLMSVVFGFLVVAGSRRAPRFLLPRGTRLASR